MAGIYSDCSTHEIVIIINVYTSLVVSVYRLTQICDIWALILETWHKWSGSLDHNCNKR